MERGGQQGVMNSTTIVQYKGTIPVKLDLEMANLFPVDESLLLRDKCKS